VLSVLTSPSSGECVPFFELNHVIGVSRAPPRLSSLPRLAAAGAVAGLPHDTERGSTPGALVPLERTVADEGSGIAGGRGKMCDPDVTCTTLSTACR
jgi:hypothetical protein